MTGADFQPPRRSWPSKFWHAFRGLAMEMRSQESFRVHLVAAGCVVGLAAVLKVSGHEWGLLVLCIAIVLAAEAFNSALERLARAVDRQENEDIAAALDIASGAVLVASLGAAGVGALVFLMRLAALFRT